MGSERPKLSKNRIQIPRNFIFQNIICQMKNCFICFFRGQNFLRVSKISSDFSVPHRVEKFQCAILELR